MERKKVASILAPIALIAATPSTGRADPIRLRGDAIAEARAPAGLVVLQGEDRARPWVSAEGLVWAGAGNPVSPDATADVHVLAVRLRDPRGLGEVRGGRFVFATGAIRPVLIDGLSGIAHAPWGSSVELTAGAPVVPRFATRPYEVVVGGRIAQTLASRATIGGSYVQERSHAELAREEAGLDFAAVPASAIDLAGRAAYDLTSPGIAEALATASARSQSLRVEIFATHRSPSRLLPATSLFSVLGDFPSEAVGSTVRWLAAPRLDLFATAAGQAAGGDLGGNVSTRALLRLDDSGDKSIGAELRREHVSTARWTGARVVWSSPIAGHFRASSELELVVPDEPHGRGAVWPWALGALSWRASEWEIAGAVEAASTPEHTFETDAIVRLSRVLEIR
jgi:hypothetical protein